MPKDRVFQVHCSHPGCKEYGLIPYRNNRERADAEIAYQKNPWKCVRHSCFEEVLSISKTNSYFEMDSKKIGDHLYWGHSGFMHGPGFKAFADDFPEGTMIRVTAEIIWPGSEGK